MTDEPRIIALVLPDGTIVYQDAPRDDLPLWRHRLRFTCPHCGCKTVNEETGRCACGGVKAMPPNPIRAKQ